MLFFDDFHQVLINFGSNFDGMGEATGSSWEDHELLHGQPIASVLASVDHIEGGAGEDHFVDSRVQLAS